MSVKKARFQKLAKKMVSKTFGDFAEDTTITTTTGFDYDTQVATTSTESFQTIREEYDENQFDGQQIKIGDYKLVGCLQDLTGTPTIINSTVTRDGQVCNLLRVAIDPADATVTLYVRPQ